MAVTTDYTGRTVDLLVFQGADPVRETTIELRLTNVDNPGGRIIAGVQKLAQVFTILFLTRKGTVNFDPDLGTDFVTRVQQGRITTENTVNTEFETAVEEIRRVLVAVEETTDVADDEQFGSAVLRSFKLDRGAGNLILFVRLRSVAGDAADILLPIPTAIK